MKQMNVFQKFGLGAVAFAAAGSANAAAVFTTTDLLADIALAGAALATVAAAIVAGPRLLKAAWGWIRGTVR